MQLMETVLGLVFAQSVQQVLRLFHAVLRRVFKQLFHFT